MNSSETGSTNEKKLYGLLSLCCKAGKIKSGGMPVMESIRAGEAKLLLIAEDASDNTKKQFQDKCNFRHVPWVIFGDRERLGRAIGVGERAGVAVIDVGFAEAISKRLHAERKGESNGKDQNF